MKRLNFCTSVDTSSPIFRLSHTMKTLMLGSCFAEYIGEHLKECKFDILVNPFGVLYNPKSIFQAIQLITDPYTPITSEDLFYDGNLWHHWMFSSKFSSPNKEQCLNQINSSLQEATTFVKHLDVLMITFGTNHCYYLQDGKCVANCHKQSEKLFTEHILNLEEIKAFTPILEKLFSLNPKLHVIFTISPYRYIKYGLHQNQLSKATILLAAEYFHQAFPNNTSYFPAYEILNDELRDYRYYADDMQHPSSLAVEYIWNIFLTDWISPQSSTFIREWQPILRSISHRPLDPSTEAYKQFISNLRDKIITIGEKYPDISIEKELSYINHKISNSL